MCHNAALRSRSRKTGRGRRGTGCLPLGCVRQRHDIEPERRHAVLSRRLLQNRVAEEGRHYVEDGPRPFCLLDCARHPRSRSNRSCIDTACRRALRSGPTVSQCRCRSRNRTLHRSRSSRHPLSKCRRRCSNDATIVVLDNPRWRGSCPVRQSAQHRLACTQCIGSTPHAGS